MGIRIVISSTGQEKDGFSIPAQLDLLRGFAEKNNIEIVKELIPINIIDPFTTVNPIQLTIIADMSKFLEPLPKIN